MAEGCIEVTGYRDPLGYGRISVNRVMVTSHRVIYCRHNGCTLESIKGLVVRHTCDNPPCINPEHLLIGTHQDNMADMNQRGRHAFGAGSKRSNLTDQDVLDIRAVYVHRSNEFGFTALAKKYGVTKQTIYMIVNKKHWRHLP